MRRGRCAAPSGPAGGASYADGVTAPRPSSSSRPGRSAAPGSRASTCARRSRTAPSPRCGPPGSSTTSSRSPTRTSPTTTSSASRCASARSATTRTSPPIAGREHVIAISRRADETAPLFAENWHTDWSFQARPPAGTCLYGITIPPHGGDTLYADQHAALDAMPADLGPPRRGGWRSTRPAAATRRAACTARPTSAPTASMDIRPSEMRMATQLHPIVREHPETGSTGPVRVHRLRDRDRRHGRRRGPGAAHRVVRVADP